MHDPTKNYPLKSLGLYFYRLGPRGGGGEGGEGRGGA